MKAKHNGAFRGLAKKVDGSLPVDGILEQAGLNWETVPMPMLIQGRKETRPSRYMSLVRSDNGHELAVATNSYTQHQNAELFGVFQQVAGETGLQIERVGCLDEGRRVFATADCKASFSLPTGPDWQAHMQQDPEHGWAKDDTTRLIMVMSSGHEPGMATSFSLWAERLICLNGAKISEDIGYLRVVHSTRLTPAHIARLRTSLEAARMRFETYEQKARRLLGTSMTREETTAYVVELLQPQLLREAVEKAVVVVPDAVRQQPVENDRDAGKRILELLMSRDSRLLDPDQFSRPVKHVLEAIEDQPGAAMAPETAWNAYNGVTYYVDHVAGRRVDSAVESSLYGNGALLKSQALDLAVEYSQRLGVRA